MILKNVAYRTDKNWLRRLADFFYVVYNPAWTIPAAVLLAYQFPVLRLPFIVHVLNLVLYKLVPMQVYGADSEKDISNHVASVTFLIMAAVAVQLVPRFLGATVLAVAGFTAIVSVYLRSQHTLPGAALGLISPVLVLTMFAVTAPIPATVVSITGIGALYAAVIHPEPPAPT